MQWLELRHDSCVSNVSRTGVAR